MKVHPRTITRQLRQVNISPRRSADDRRSLLLTQEEVEQVKKLRRTRARSRRRARAVTSSHQTMIANKQELVERLNGLIGELKELRRQATDLGTTVNELSNELSEAVEPLIEELTQASIIDAEQEGSRNETETRSQEGAESSAQRPTNALLG